MSGRSRQALVGCVVGARAGRPVSSTSARTGEVWCCSGSGSRSARRRSRCSRGRSRCCRSRSGPSCWSRFSWSSLAICAYRVFVLVDAGRGVGSRRRGDDRRPGCARCAPARRTRVRRRARLHGPRHRVRRRGARRRSQREQDLHRRAIAARARAAGHRSTCAAIDTCRHRAEVMTAAALDAASRPARGSWTTKRRRGCCRG